MIEIKDIGKFESVPEIVSDIVNGDVNALEEQLSKGWDINEEIVLSKYTRLLPLNLAIMMNEFKSVKWLATHGAELNDEDNPSFLTAVRYSDEETIRYLVSQGADVNSVNSVETEAFEQAIFGERLDNLALIDELGHTVKKHGGAAFRNCLDKRNYDVVDFFTKKGVDINYNKPDSIYPFKPTPLCVAARYVDLEMCKYLVEHGADVTITEKDGMRPYSIALEKGDDEMAEYFKGLEPTEFHSLHNKLDELKAYKLPKAMIDLLQSDNLHFELPNCDFGYIEFFGLTETVPMKLGRRKVLRLSRSTGDYSDIYVVWNPKTKKVAVYDAEHEELKDLCGFKDFIDDMARHLQRVLEGEL